MYLEEIHEKWLKSKENLIQVNIQKKSFTKEGRMELEKKQEKQIIA